MATKSKAPVSTTLIHERNGAAQHRIVHVRGGIPTASKWFEHHQVAVYGNYRALYNGNEALPTGVFRVTEVPHEVLS